ncbi:unnamed protein product, partial [Amoebophrya sp. A25]|eukprot:GSA25T00025689001.1
MDTRTFLGLTCGEPFMVSMNQTEFVGNKTVRFDKPVCFCGPAEDFLPPKAVHIVGERRRHYTNRLTVQTLDRQFQKDEVVDTKAHPLQDACTTCFARRLLAAEKWEQYKMPEVPETNQYKQKLKKCRDLRHIRRAKEEAERVARGEGPPIMWSDVIE